MAMLWPASHIDTGVDSYFVPQLQFDVPQSFEFVAIVSLDDWVGLTYTVVAPITVASRCTPRANQVRPTMSHH